MAEIKIKERMNTGKMLRIGNSIGIVIPSGALKFCKWQLGDFIRLTYDPKKDTFELANVSKSYRKGK